MQQKSASIKCTDRSSQPKWPSIARFIQVNLGLDDLNSINASALMDRLKALGANGVVFNTGGIYAWYPSKVAGHTVHPSLGDRDAVAEAANAAHDAGLAFIGRFDFSLIEKPLANANPDWVARTDIGTPLEIGGPRTDGRPPLIATAMTGAYRRERLRFRLQNPLSKSRQHCRTGPGWAKSRPLRRCNLISWKICISALSEAAAEASSRWGTVIQFLFLPEPKKLKIQSPEQAYSRLY